MIDLKLAREDPDGVRRSQLSRGEDPGLVDVLLDADVARRAAISAADTRRAEQKAASKSVGAASAQDRPALLAQAQQLAADVRDAQARQAEAEAAFHTAHLAIPNVIIEGVPPGGEDDYVVLDVVGEPRSISAPKDHLELGEALGLIDTARGVKVSGSRFYFLTGHGALLQLGLLQLAVRLAVANGFTLMIPPVLVRPEVMAGTGFLGAHADEIYHLEADDLYLVGTSEVPLAGYHAEEILDLSAGPLRYAGWSTCFRREAGSYGKDTRGLIRQHQFNKVELVQFTAPEDSSRAHEALTGHAEKVLQNLGLHYRVVDLCAGDLGNSAARTYDLEVWLPGQGAYREISSCSNFRDFQSRRAAIRYRPEPGKKPLLVHTLNGSGLAVGRTVVAILENYQTADARVRIPEVLRPWMRNDEFILPQVA